jgi:hypothetical protein
VWLLVVLVVVVVGVWSAKVKKRRTLGGEARPMQVAPVVMRDPAQRMATRRRR